MKTPEQIAAKKLSGKKARQKGEDVKNLLSANLSFFGNNPTTQVDSLINFLNIDIQDISFITTKSKEDKGKESCVKPDLIIAIDGNLPNDFKFKQAGMSVKSTFAETQVAIHSLNSFEANLKAKKVIMPTEAKEFLYHFLHADLLYKNDPILYAKKPTSIFAENIRRDRFSVNEINNFNPNLLVSFSNFIQQNAKTILKFLIAEGNGKRKDYANILVFCDNNASNCFFVDTELLIEKIISTCETNNSWIICGQDKKLSGITTLSLFNGLIRIQMKGSGEKDKISYHCIQFKICGRNIKKFLD